MEVDCTTNLIMIKNYLCRHRKLLRRLNLWVPSCSSSTATAGSTAATTPASVESFAISSHMPVFNSCEQQGMWHSRWLLRDSGQDSKKRILHSRLPLSNRGIFIINSSNIRTNCVEFTSRDLWPLRGLLWKEPLLILYTFVHIKVY